MQRISKKEKIIEVGFKHFSKYGYENTTLENIAKECGITKPAIYYHFKSKAHLYKEIVCKYFNELVTQIEESTVNGSEIDRLKSYIFTFGLYLIKHPSFNTIFATEIANGAKNLPNECIGLLSKTLNRLKSILDDGAKNNIFEKTNPFLVQMMIVTTLTSYNTTKPLRKKIAKELNLDEAFEELDFNKIIEEVAKKIIKGIISH